ncbi:hypothetical protein V1525DRAFT_101138 [Lipomyces kononenkoae]|uniref:Uncharacterized protein n=1 Tax=Lipomyces kononenkoae TaxID=34357 RepID=A0ACC3T704_LIPKO
MHDAHPVKMNIDAQNDGYCTSKYFCRQDRISLDSRSGVKESVARHSFTMNTPGQRRRSLQDPQSLTVQNYANTNLLGRYAREYDLAALPRRSILRSNSKLLGLNFKPLYRHAHSRLPTPITNRNNCISRACTRPFKESVRGSRIPVLSPKSAKGSNTPTVNQLPNAHLDRKRVSFSNHVRVLTFRKVENDRSGQLTDMPRAWISRGWTHWQKPSASRIGRRSQVNTKKHNQYVNKNDGRCGGVVRRLSSIQETQDILSNYTAPAITPISSKPQDEYERQGDSRPTWMDVEHYRGPGPVIESAETKQHNYDNETTQGRCGMRISAGYTTETQVSSDSDDVRSDQRSNGTADNDTIVKSGSTPVTILLSWTNVETIERTNSRTFSFLLKFILFYIAVTSYLVSILGSCENC